MDGFWGERKNNEERYYSDSLIKYVIVIKGFNENVLFLAMESRFMYQGGKIPQFKMDGDPRQYGGAKGFRKCRHHEPTNPL